MTTDDHSHLAQLGNKVEQPPSPDHAVLETIPWRSSSVPALRFTCPEFTSLCPVTGQPDFATIVIDYAPNAALVESKSLKLFLASFRNHPGFHEAVTVNIGNRFRDACRPFWLRVAAFFYPRGGIPIDVVWQPSPPPEDIYVLPYDIPLFRGR